MPDMHRSLFLWLGLFLMVVGGCAASQSQPAVSAATTPVAATPPGQLQGFWAEYWARAGQAETQRYVFLADGRFGWLAPLRDVPRQDPLQRSGSYSIEGNLLLLDVSRERFAACTAGCAQAGEAKVVEHAEPLRISLELGDCPANEEAAQLDASYQCRSIGGRAFWLRAAPDEEAAAPFFH